MPATILEATLGTIIISICVPDSGAALAMPLLSGSVADEHSDDDDEEKVTAPYCVRRRCHPTEQNEPLRGI